MQYLVGGTTNCDEPLCCRKPLVSPQSESFFDKIRDEIISPFTKSNDLPIFRQKAMKWGDYRYCDLPWWTFEDLLKKLSNSNKFGSKSIDYILFTGDLPAHDVWNQTKQQQIDIVHKVASAFTEYFPNTPVFPAIGNHDSFPANSFPPHELRVEAKYRIDWVYSLYAKAWKKWLPFEALQVT